jgi:GNAT superfamily N-acetyltransferase
VPTVTRCENEAGERLSLEIYNAVWPHDTYTFEDASAFKTGLRDHADFLAQLDGAVAGSALAAVFPERAERVFMLVTVLPESRGRGAGSALYEAVSAWALERALGAIEVPVADNDPGSLAFGLRRGFVEDRREMGLVLSLRGLAQPSVDPPPGVEIVTWDERPELAHGMYEVALEATPDIPGSEDEVLEPFEAWLVSHMQAPADRPEATFIALARDEVVGYAKLSLTAAQPDIAHHDLSAVKRAWRGRGVARALKAAEIAWAIDAGYDELRTRNEQRNEPIRRLNERFGYRPGIGRIYLVGSPSSGP